MAFREKIELLIDVTTTGARSSLQSLKGDIDQADGAFGKIKAGASGVFGGMGNMVAGGLAAAGGAIAGFAVKAIGDFQNLALAAGEMGAKLGLPAEDASRLMEVAGDLGIEVGTLESAIGRMNLTASKAPEKFAAIGAEIARNKDGTINVTETFKNAAEAIQRIPDAADRAKAAQEVFGKGWQGVAELIEGGAEGITEAMGAVEDAKVIDEEEIAKARRFRDTMDELKGKFESFSLVAGEALVSLTGWLEKGGDIWGDVRNNFAALEEDIGEIFKDLPWVDSRSEKDAEQFWTDVVNASRTGVEQVTGGMDALDRSFIALGDRFRDVGAEAAAWPGVLGLAKIGLEGLRDGMIEAAAAAEEQKAAQDALTDSIRNAADANIAAEDAQRAFTDAARATIDATNEHGASSRETEDAVRNERDAMIDAADAAVEQATAFWEANGATISSKDSLDTFNKSLLSNAQYATPAARNAIAEYIIQANGIPEEKATEIRAAIARGDIPTAERLINEVSRDRNAAVNVDANTGAAESEIQSLIRTRNMTINANIVTRGGAGYGGLTGARAGGGTVYGPGGETTVVGENGPEVVRLPTGSHVFRNGESRDMGVGGSGPTYAITVNATGTSVDDATEAVKRAMWVAGAKPTPGGRRVA